VKKFLVSVTGVAYADIGEPVTVAEAGFVVAVAEYLGRAWDLAVVPFDTFAVVVAAEVVEQSNQLNYAPVVGEIHAVVVLDIAAGIVAFA
jgi:hypothetical protein